ncbi:chromosomal replication initiator protein DnaA [Hyphomicrobiales bacterium]|nr:chromosomal replication initiator protein DnaA [Hyphomicrobiales bacterium]
MDTTIKKNISIVNQWDKISVKLRAQLGDDLYNSWFTRVVPSSYDAGTLTLSVPTLFLRSWIKSRYSEKLLDLWKVENSEIKRIELRVRAHGESSKSKSLNNNQNINEGNTKNNNGLNPGSNVNIEDDLDLMGHGTPLDRRFTFSNYVIGRSNALAHAAASRVACPSKSEPIEFNPLYIHGPVGTGKTHLMNSIAWESRSKRPDRKVLFLSAVRFMSSFVEAVKARDTITFKKIFADVDILLIDDMQFLQGKAVQQEFCHIFNALDTSKHQIVIAGDLPPSKLEMLDDRMKSRLSGGLVAQIGPTDFDIRRGILEKRLSQTLRGNPRIEISQAVLDFLARRIQSSGRELEGAMNRIIAAHSLNKRPITVEEAAATIQDLISEEQNRQVMIEDVLRAISGHFNVTKQDLLSARRHKTIVYPRQIGMYLSKILTSRSLPEIGRKFGGRDHTTVLHAVRKIERLIKEDAAIRTSIESLGNSLRE